MSVLSADKRFAWPVRIYWEDTDAGGIVYYANYLKYMERARTERLRAAGVDQTQLLARHDLMFVVVEVQARYRRPARYGDELLVTCEVVEHTRASLSFSQQIHRGGLDGELLVQGQARVACLAASSMRPQPLPDDILRELIQTGAG